MNFPCARILSKRLMLRWFLETEKYSDTFTRHQLKKVLGGDRARRTRLQQRIQMKNMDDSPTFRQQWVFTDSLRRRREQVSGHDLWWVVRCLIVNRIFYPYADNNDAPLPSELSGRHLTLRRKTPLQSLTARLNGMTSLDSLVSHYYSVPAL